MAHFTFNISKGRAAELYNRVKNADPGTCAIVLVPLEASGLESDATLMDKDTLAAVLSGSTNEQTTMGRKVLLAADLAAIPAPDNANDRNDRSLPTVTWAAAAGNPISKIIACYRVATADVDSVLVPMTAFDYVATPSGIDLQVTGGVFFRASQPA